MSGNFSKTEKRRARKVYACDALVLIEDWGPRLGDVTREELDAIELAQAEGGRILVGREYLHTRGIWEGMRYTAHCRPELEAICQKYDLYEH